MIAPGLDVMYRQALAAGHEPYTRIEVWRGQDKLADDLTFVTGHVTATLTSQTSRILDMSLDRSFYPVNDDDLLNPFGNELHVWRGIKFGEGSRYEFPVFVGRIWTADVDETGDCVIHAQDRSADVVDNRFRVPSNSQVGAYVSDEVRRLISDALPLAAFADFDLFYTRVPILTWEYERGSALDELATALGAFWYAQADGQFVLRRYPWTIKRDPIVTYSDGDGGTVTKSHAHRQREGIYNVVTVTGERLDGTAPVFGTAQDDNPASPTFTGGPFGVRSLVRRLTTPANQETAAGAARQLLKRATAFTEAWSFTTVPDAALELGDPIQLNVQDRTGIIQVVASIQMPLDTLGSMQVGCRAMVVSQLEEGG